MNQRRDEFRYLPLGARTKRWGLYVTGCGRVTIPPHGEHPPQGHPHLYEFSWDRGRVLPEYQVILLVEGQGEFESAGAKLRPIAAGEALLVFPGIWHRYRPSHDTGWTSYWIGVGGTFVDHLASQGFLAAQRPVISPSDYEEMVASFQRVVGLATSETIENPLLLSAVAMEVLAGICGSPGDDSVEPSTAAFQEVVQDRIVAEALRLIWNSSDLGISVSDLADQLPVSRRSLERRFQEVLGRTVLVEITRCRVERVRSLLEETDLPLKQLAKLAGFSSAGALTKAFQRQVRVAPSAYRKQQTETHEC